MQSILHVCITCLTQWEGMGAMQLRDDDTSVSPRCKELHADASDAAFNDTSSGSKWNLHGLKVQICTCITVGIHAHIRLQCACVRSYSDAST